MTPAEQGQERYETTVHDKRTGAPVAGCDGNALAELEMCQRYFPFMRRSRDEAVRKLSACQEERDQADALYAQKQEEVHRHFLRAEAARDEAVKSEKRRTDELARLRGILNEEERRRSDAQEREKALRAAIERALEPLGTGDCSVNACDGCEWETKEAIRILRAALDQSGNTDE